MNLTGQQLLPVTQAQAWAALNDTAMLQAAVPGCEAITPAGENAFDVLMALIEARGTTVPLPTAISYCAPTTTLHSGMPAGRAPVRSPTAETVKLS